MPPGNPKQIRIYSEKNQIQRYRKQASGYQWEKGRRRGSVGVGEEEVQTVMHNVSYKGMLCNTGNIASVL